MIRSFVLLGLFLISLQSIAMDPQHIVFIGNPGTGKSALINSLIGKKVAESGLSLTGLTTHLQKIEHDGLLFIDTPGLADIEIQDQAVLEIQKSLKFGGIYKIFFVLNIKAGRIVERDCDTINRVMKAIDNAEKRFHIVINKIDELEKEEIFNNPDFYEEFCRILKGKLALKPTSITTIDLDNDLKKKNRDFIGLDEKERQFLLQEASGFYLGSHQVRRILTEAAEIRELQEQQAAAQT